MLWYKAWRESRVRFLLIVLFVVFYCVFGILTEQGDRLGPSSSIIPLSYDVWIYLIYVGRYAFYFLVLFLPLLSMGGLLRENARGTAALSLSLPVSRRQLVGVRAAVGLMQMAALAFLPSIIIPLLSPLVRESYPISAALHFGFLRVIGGAAFFALAYLFSTLLAGEYTALVVSAIAVVSIVQITQWLPHRFSSAWIMSGAPALNTPAEIRNFTGLPGPYAWSALFVIATIALALFAMATRIAQLQDF
jgi:ABC-type transport system involved in multi-copper enzyme maturation permease subunit